MPKETSEVSVEEVVADPRHERRVRRRFSQEDKKRIVEEARGCEERGEIAALLRREGLYRAQLTAWQKQMAEHGAAGLAPHRTGRKALMSVAEKRVLELEKKNARLERELYIAKELLSLQKKAQAIWDAASGGQTP